MIATADGSLPTIPTETITLDVGGMMCAGCVSAVTRKLKQQIGVQDAVVNLITEVATVTALPTLTAEVLTTALTQAGFPTTARSHQIGQRRTDQLAALTQRRTEQASKQRQRLTIALILVLVSSAGHLGHTVGRPLPGLGNDGFHAVLAGLALFIPGREILRDGLKGLLKNSPNMNTLIALGSLLAFGTSLVALIYPAIGWECFFDEPVMLVGFILLGRSLEAWGRREALSSFQALIALQPQTARLVANTTINITIASDEKTLSDLNPNLNPNPNPSEAIVIPVEHLRLGEWVQVLPGEQIPVDGILVAGSSTLDESMLTGEAIPVEKIIGDKLSAGTLNRSGLITLEITQLSSNTQLAKIIQWVEDAQTRRAPVQQLADQIAGYFTYIVLTLSVLTFLGWYFFGQSLLLDSQSAMSGMDHMAGTSGMHGIDRLPPSPLLMSLKLAISLMVVACPCALGLATPTALIVGSSLGAQRGLLIRGGDVLQQVERLDTVVFDKTGTLTMGCPQVQDILPTAPNLSPDRLLQLTATLESGTQHPLALAILTAARNSKLSLLSMHDSQTIAGCGVQATVENQSYKLGTSAWLTEAGVTIESSILQQAEQFGKDGKTVIFIAQDCQLLGLITVTDTLRPEASDTIQALQDQGLRVMLLTGDRLSVAKSIATQVGIPQDQIIAEVLPQEKADAIAKLQQNGHCVAMVGDGINDAPALAQADVGIALKGGTDVASETAGIVLLRDRLSDVLAALTLSRMTLRTIYVNLGWAMIYNIIAIPVAAGLLLPIWKIVLTPGQAGILMAVSSITVVGNSILLRYWAR
jgi:Cu2+-exporting ATPase